MKSSSSPRWLSTILIVFATGAAFLWLLPLSVTRPILFPGGPVFADALVYKGRFTLYHTAKFFTSRAYSAFAYPAGAAPVYELLYKTSDPVLTYQMAAGVITLAMLGGAFVFLKRRNLLNLFAPLLLLSYPLVFLIQRANIEIVLWLIVAVAILAYRRGLAVVAAILIGIAAAIKLYPILLLGLFLKRKQDLPAFITGVVASVVTMLAAVVYAGPTFGIAANGFFTGVNRFQDHYVETVSKVEVVFDHCLFSPVKYWTYLHHTSPAPYTHTYFAVAGTLALLLFLRVRTLPFLNRVLFLVAAMVCLPPVSFAYTLVHLYLPLLLLLTAMATFRTRPPATAVVSMVLLPVLTLPLPSLNVFQPVATGPMLSYALLAILILCAVQPWPEASIKADA